MKSVFDVTKHQLTREVNLLAKRVVDKNYSRDMIKKEIEYLFCSVSHDERESIFNRIIQKSYSDTWMLTDTILSQRTSNCIEDVAYLNSVKILVNQIKDSFVVRLSDKLIPIINTNSFKLARGSRFEEEFFNHCLDKLINTDLHNEINDIELFTIYLKQFVIILRNSNLFLNENNTASVTSNTKNYENTYLSLFYSFWINVKWQDIFPSLPDVARELKRNKRVLIDLILNAGNSFSISDISKEIIDLIGLGDYNNLVLISFLDFYFFTWMKHFGILRYINGMENDLVNAQITDHGNRFLKHLQDL